MNALDKIKMVQKGLKCCNDTFACDGCPYDNSSDCKRKLNDDALAVIDALKAELKKRTSKAVEAKPGFIVLTTGIVLHHDDSATWYDCCGTAIQVKDILTISDYDKCKGSLIQLKDSQQTSILVQETLEEILDKIAKGEEE